MTTSHQWTVDSALCQLRWEPSERRASAVSYLTSVLDGSASYAVVREVAAGLLALYDTHVPVKHSALCSSRITGEDRCNCVQPGDRTT
jgi:hypothetical protein